MTFEEARASLIENAVGVNNYENLTLWQELGEAAGQEIFFAEDRIRKLQSIEERAAYAE